MTFAVRGLLEGFYDRLWTWAERERVAERVAELGFDTYVYAPKEDRAQNAGWRVPYPTDEATRLEAFVRRCRDLGLSPWLGMRPVGISYADEADLEILLERLRGAVAMGADRILLLADDIPPTLEGRTAGRFRRLDDAHAWLVERGLHALDGAVPLVFCPTDYAGPGSSYLARLGTVLPSEVDICWTGLDVCVPRITADQVNAISEVLHRPPMIWDNYPVNDDGMVDQLHIGPIRGRDAVLDRSTRGILVNAALQPEAGLVPLATWSEYLRDPAAYHPDAAFARAVEWVAGELAADDARAVATIAAAYDRSVIPQGWSHPAPHAIAAAIARLPRLRNRALAEDLAPFVGARSS